MSRDYAIKICKDIDTLIIIGYSFPIFNRKIDMEILNSLKDVKTIYIQNKVENINAIKSRIISLVPEFKEKILPVEDTTQFFIPHDYI